MRTNDNKPVKIAFTIKDCSECPFVKNKHTPGTGYGQDYFCSKKGMKKVMGYIEWPSEHKPVPLWCPIRARKVKPKTGV